MPVAIACQEEQQLCRPHTLAHRTPPFGPHPPICQEELLPHALKMASDKVANLRFILAASLQRAAAHLSVGTLSSRIIPALEALEHDRDIDVLDAAREALEVCHELCHN